MQPGAEASCKTLFVMALLRELVANRHRVLLFSQSRLMLDLLESAVRTERLPFLRVDGTTSSAKEREVRS